MKEGLWAVRSNHSDINVSYVASSRGQERLAPSRPPPEDHHLVQDVVESMGRSLALPAEEVLPNVMLHQSQKRMGESGHRPID